MIDVHVRRMHELAWFAGAHMHGSWWAYLGLDCCESMYRNSDFCRLHIDRAIAACRGFPVGPLPLRIRSPGQLLLRREERLPAMIVGIGLAALRHPEYLLMPSYRSALATCLNATDCDQLLALARVTGPATPHVSPQNIIDFSLRCGLQWLDRDLAAESAWQALRVLMIAPAAGGETAEKMRHMLPQEHVEQTLMRVGRLL